MKGICCFCFYKHHTRVEMGKTVICIPSYKNVTVLQRLLDSVYEQTYRDFTIVITDDTDSNEVKKLVEDYESSKLFYEKNKKRLGATANCNKSILLAQRLNPDFIKVMHHDDFFSFDYSLERLVDLLEKEKKSQMVFSGTYQVGIDKSYERCISTEDVKGLEQDYRYLYTANVIGAPSAVLIRNTGIYMDENLKWLVDLEWYMRILKENNSFSYTFEPLISIGVGEEQLTNSCIQDPKLQIREYKYVYKKFNELHQKKYRNHLKNVIIQNRKMQLKRIIKSRL